MFVAVQDFNQVPYNVPDAQIEEPGTGNIVDNQKFVDFIAKAEKDLLIKILGGEFYQQFVDAINALPAPWVQKVSPDGYSIDDLVLSSDEHVYKSLVGDNVALLTDGASWELQVDSKWLLLKNGDTYTFCKRKYFWNGVKSLLVPAIYSLWLRATFDNHSKFGIVVANVENAGVRNPGDRIVDSWNVMVRLAGNFYMQENTLYGYVFQTNLIDERFLSVYQDNFSTFNEYLNASFCRLKTQNVFGL